MYSKARTYSQRVLLAPPPITKRVQDIMNILNMSSTQWNFTSLGMGGAMKVGLNYSAIFLIAKKLGIKLGELNLYILQLGEQQILKQEAKERA